MLNNDNEVEIIWKIQRDDEDYGVPEIIDNSDNKNTEEKLI